MIFKRLFAVVFLLLISSAVFAESSVFLVSKNGQKIVLGGTMHLLRPSDFPLPAEYDDAFYSSNEIYFETNIEQVSAPAFGQRLASEMMFKNGSSLKNEIEPELWAELKKFSSSRNFPLESFNIFHPAYVAMVITVFEFQRLGISGGVESHFQEKKGTGTSKNCDFSSRSRKHRADDCMDAGGSETQEAKAENRSLLELNEDSSTELTLRSEKKCFFSCARKHVFGELESPDDVVASMREMTKVDGNALIRSTLRDVENFNGFMDFAVNAWRTGDLDGLYNKLAKDMKKETPGVYKALIVNRNHKWLPTIEKMFETKEREFVLVGALHLAGPDGLLKLLEDKGYKIKKYRIKKR